MADKKACPISIDTEYTDEVVCPWCGHKHTDSYEFFKLRGECSQSWCGSCGKPIEMVRHISVSYSSSKGDF